jgi:outer membrane protein insertion porin family
LNFNEGKAAKVVDINIIGNTVFSDVKLNKLLQLKKVVGLLLLRNDRYAREKMAASLEALRAYI